MNESKPAADMDAFLSRAKQARQAVEKMSHPTVVNHYDCDGLSAGAIVCKFLEDKNIRFEVMTIRKLDDNVLQSLKEKKEIIFADLGGG
ncbi:MAG: hypothetical protein WC492_05170, partial [Candidatus Micrarchaeia archaeon]